MSTAPPPADGIAAAADSLCLDFVNTRYWRGSETPTETLHGLEDVLGFAAGPGGVDQAVVAAMRDWWQARPGEAQAAFTAALDLRESLYRMFADGDGHGLAVLNESLAAVAPRARLLPRGDGYAWSVAGLRPGMAALLSPVLWSAADLLAGVRRGRVRFCANPRCRWAFLDDSKSGNRRWCAMSACGNRAKAHRHYQKKRAAG